MCFHRRLVFSCSHYAWLGITQPCELEESFNHGDIDTGCSVKWSHGYDTTRVQEKCPKCIQIQEGHGFRFGIVKEQIKVLKEHLKMIKGASEIKDEEWLNRNPEQNRDAQSDCIKDGDAATLPLENKENTGDALLFEGGCGCLNEIMDRVRGRVDPQHRPLALPQIVAQRMATDAEAVAAVEDPAQPK